MSCSLSAHPTLLDFKHSSTSSLLYTSPPLHLPFSTPPLQLISLALYFYLLPTNFTTAIFALRLQEEERIAKRDTAVQLQSLTKVQSPYNPLPLLPYQCVPPSLSLSLSLSFLFSFPPFPPSMHTFNTLHRIALVARLTSVCTRL